VTLGNVTVEMVFCVTEEIVADLFTKLVVLAQDTLLTVRFYTLLSDYLGFSGVVERCYHNTSTIPGLHLVLSYYSTLALVHYHKLLSTSILL
jgi:hypothetical protein